MVEFFSRTKGRDAFESLVSPHVGHLYRCAYRFTGRREDAEDLVQDLLVQLFARRVELARVQQLRPWLVRALYHLFIDKLRHHAHDPLRRAEEDAILNDRADTAAHAEGPRLLLQRQLERAIQTLNPDQRAVVVLHDVEGYNLVELESMLDTPVGTLKSRLHRARQHLRQAIGVELCVDDFRVDEKGVTA